jgi:para-aminobenzoate synthetase component 1
LSTVTSTPPLVPLIHELSPAPDPWLVCRQLASLPHLLFLDSAGGPAPLRRYSFLTADPFRWLQARGRRAVLLDRLPESSAVFHFEPADPFSILQEQLQQWHVPALPGLPPFQGGAAGLFGYDLCHHLERLPRPARDEFAVPDLALGFYDWVIAFDHAAGRAWLIATGLPETLDPKRRRRADGRLRQIRELLGRSTLPALALPPGADRPVNPGLNVEVAGVPGLLSNFDRGRYLDTIRRAVEYIHAGDCFQVNVAQRLLYPAHIPPLELYGRLRQRNPAPFAGYFDLGAFVIASASPERFLLVKDGDVETRPIKGTRPRGSSPAEEQANAAELLRSAKDRAENVMIVDLLRNDLGRVCAYGSVRVTQVCQLETFQYVHHLVSEVRGRLRAGMGTVDLLRAAFPGGSVTGAPKIRAMEIIAELEGVARGPYCGCLGYLGFDGSMDTNILIRTFTCGGGWVQLPVGGGIVADSVPELEYEETWHKARGSVQALR